MEIRTFESSDADAVVAVWRASGVAHPNNDPMRDIDRKVADSPEGFLVAVVDGTIVGTVMLGYDGHRGWINYLATAPGHQRRGVATALMAEARHRLLACGCPKVNLQVREGNDAAIAFYRAIGYDVDPVVSLGLRLIPDD